MYFLTGSPTTPICTHSSYIKIDHLGGGGGFLRGLSDDVILQEDFPIDVTSLSITFCL